MAEQTPWERDTIEKLLFETMKEQRRQRRWKLFFRFIFLGLIIYFVFWATHSTDSALKKTKSHTAVIDIHGIIEDRGQASADNVIDALQEVFQERNVQGIILRINSPGGSGVQASEIYNEVMRQRQLHKNIPIYAVCEDYCTSAAYYIASAAQDIYSNPASLVGSIGVMINGFGFVDTLSKLGVQRRLITSGSDKGFLDPFSPLKKEDEITAQQILNEVHQQFINDVKRGRGSRLKITDDIFSGKPWTGTGAKSLGLIDGFGSVDFVARDIIKNKNMVFYNTEGDFFERISGKFSSSLKQTIRSELLLGLS